MKPNWLLNNYNSQSRIQGKIIVVGKIIKN